VRSAIISAERGTEAMSIPLISPLTRYPHFVLLPGIWTMRQGVTADDAAYLALAGAPDAPLVTRDRAPAKVGAKVPGEVIGRLWHWAASIFHDTNSLVSPGLPARLVDSGAP